ncbi:MAG TPA: tRNA lysidine(34) synthetase TilS [Rhodanobacteraceae bacterium]|nr:tRNA lysidine(34) synthetase TilS [Rhodanobacteraceae bacterium]
MWLSRLRDEIRAEAPSGLCVAFSGGRDSSVLLHALAQVPEARELGLRALHVDHGLHPKSADWAAHCAGFCESLDVPLVALRATVDGGSGEGIEAAARRARYAAFAESLHAGEWLALAHHRDDQVETVLLKLLRGAGPEGLGGMRARRSFGRGTLWRPLLETRREELDRYAASHAIEFLDDPANRDPRFARNLLRHELVPLLERHWPHAGTAILHSARLCRVAGDYLAREADAALALLQREYRSLDADGWCGLPEALRAPVLDRWLRNQDLPIPADAQRRELERQVSTAAEDAVPCVAWPGAEVHIWDGGLHASQPMPPLPGDWRAAWNGKPLTLPDGCGILFARTADSASPARAIFDPPLEVRLRRGGERIKPDGDPHTRELRDLFQQARIPPWVRERCPLIYEHDELIAVVDWWTSERGRAVFDAQGARPRWQRPASAAQA